MSQHADEAGGSLTLEAQGRVGAAPTTTGWVSTARWPGVGPSTAATLTAEIGDIWRFADVDLLAYAGVHPKEQSSGTKGANPETSWSMAKTGNAYLRAAAYRMAVVGVQHNPILRAHYARKRAAGKSARTPLVTS